MKKLKPFPEKQVTKTPKSYEENRFNSIINPYFSFTQNNDNERRLHESLVQEAIQIKGSVLVYIPREYVDIDEIFGEDAKSYFDVGYRFAAYVKNYESFEGAGAFFSKFGYEANDEIELEFNPALFGHQVNGLQPRAGDLVYLPLNNTLFEVTYVQPINPYGQLGSTQALRTMQCTKFTPSHEDIDIDIVSTIDHLDVDEFSLEELAEPINNLNGKAGSRIDGNDYADVEQAEEDLKDVLDPYVVLEGTPDDTYFEETDYAKDINDPFRFIDK